ncbi:MAG: hypothetical protein R3F60_20595 [bacterium]
MNPSRAAGLLVGLIAPAVSSTPLAAPAPPPASGQTSIGLEIGLEAEVCAGYTEPRYGLFPFSDSDAPRATWRQRHATRPLAASVRHQTAGGFVVGGQVAAILGRLVEGSAHTTEGQAIPLDDGAYTLFGGALLAGRRTATTGVELGLGALGAAGAELELVQGIRGLWGDLSLADGSPMWWFEASLGTVDTLVEPSNLAAGLGFEVAALRARLGVAWTDLPVLDRRICGYCGQLAEAEAGAGPYLEVTGHLGHFDLRGRVVYQEWVRLSAGVGATF